MSDADYLAMAATCIACYLAGCFNHRLGSLLSTMTTSAAFAFLALFLGASA